MKTFMATYAVYGTLLIEAENDDAAREIAENMSNKEILDSVGHAINGDGYEVRDIQEY